MFNIEEEMIPFFITATLLTIIFIFFMMVSFVRLKNKQIKKEHELLHALIGERERTMYTISVEIHDNINQMLNLASMTLKIIRKHAVPEQQKYIVETGNMLDNAIGDLRNISHSLNSDYLKSRGLYESLKEMERWVNITRELSFSLEVKGEVKLMEQDKELMLIRIAQEAVNNTLKHAQAEHLSIYLIYEPDQFRMIVKDDGTGFKVNPGSPWEGVGLQSIYERSRIIKSNIEVQSVPSEGTAIVLTLANPRYAA